MWSVGTGLKGSALVHSHGLTEPSLILRKNVKEMHQNPWSTQWIVDSCQEVVVKQPWDQKSVVLMNPLSFNLAKAAYWESLWAGRSCFLPRSAVISIKMVIQYAGVWMHLLHLVQLLSLLFHIFSEGNLWVHRWNATFHRFKGSDFIDQIHTICSILGTPEALGGSEGLLGGEGRLHYSNPPPSVAGSILMP